MTAMVLADNFRSRALMRTLGFRPCGRDGNVMEFELELRQRRQMSLAA
jgi:RimJ/RimL family protein N-acetyltransferase